MRAARAAAIGLAALAIATRASAGFPDWAKTAAGAAPPVPDGMPEWPERALLTDTSIVVSDQGATWRIARRKVVQVLSARVDPTSFEFFHFDDTTKVKKAKGWHAPPGERAQRDGGGALELSLSPEFLTDDKTRVVSLEGVKKGSVVAYEFVAESKPYTLTTLESFYDDAPIDLARWSIELPPSWELKYAWLNGKGPEPTHSGNTWVFEQHDLIPAREDKLDEDPFWLAPRLVVALQPPAGSAAAAPAFPDWNAVAQWYHDLAKGRDAASPEIAAASKAILAKAGAAPLDRIRAVSLSVRDRVRYLAREVGIGGYQPHAASQVFSELYGDCKDKGTLLRAELSAAGFDSVPILINATNPNTVSREVPAPGSFDHFIVGVVWPKDAPFPDEAASARVDAGELGTLLVIDATDEYAWPGTLPDKLAGKTGVAVSGGRGVLITLPAGEPKWHRIARNASVAVAADRSVAIQMVSRMYGGPAEEARAANAGSFKDRRESVEDDLRSSWPGAVVNDYKIVAEDTDGAYVETVSLSLPAGAAALQEDTYWVFAGAPRDIDRVPLGKRRTAVRYPYPFEYRYEATVTGVAPESTLPSPVTASGSAWSVESTFRRDGESIRGAWTASLQRTHFPPEAFPELKQFWSAAAKAAAPGLRLAP
jgi:hypothetical protein